MISPSTFPSTSPTPRRGDEPLLSVRDLSVTFGIKNESPFTAVDGLSFDVRPGQTVGPVGESGCGKSVTSLAVMGLLPPRGNPRLRHRHLRRGGPAVPLPQGDGRPGAARTSA
ncbi:ATP-binding cassette domain-containing protein [Janibacter limosus]|uniref:ATP-binding cassette domain-containing protein n=1 Tax=Janibacter limosus TaxID=53458 RepID=UPI00406A70E4